MDNSLLACKCLIELVSGVFAQLVLAMVFKTIGGFEQSSQWVQFPYIPALQSALDTELRTSIGISICHGNKTKNKQKHLPRINTEFHGNKTKNKQKHLPRINTEFHGNKQKQKIRHGNKTLLSEPDA